MVSEAVIGREHELAVARMVVDGLAGGPQALLIEGDAGIGKTAVWRAALGLAGRALVCVADEADARLSFSGLADPLHGGAAAPAGGGGGPGPAGAAAAAARGAGGRARAPRERVRAPAGSDGRGRGPAS